jgi:hypothetical protein
LAASLALAACGGDGSSDREASSSSTAKQAAPATAGDAKTTVPVIHAGRKHNAKKGHQPKPDRAKNGVAVDKSAAQPADSSGGSAKAAPAAKAPSTVAPTSGKAIFNVAKGICSNPAMLAGVPAGIRNDDKAVAKYAEIFAPPGHEKQAHDGCLAGLKKLGR